MIAQASTDFVSWSLCGTLRLAGQARLQVARSCQVPVRRVSAELAQALQPPCQAVFRCQAVQVEPGVQDDSTYAGNVEALDPQAFLDVRFRILYGLDVSPR